MFTTIVLVVIGLSLIGIGAYLWYRRHIDDESSFGHDDVRWEQIDADIDLSMKKTVSDIDQLTAVNAAASDTDRSSHCDSGEVDDSFDKELEQMGQLMREHDGPKDASDIETVVELGHATAVSELQELQEPAAAKPTLDDDPEMVVSVHVVAKAGREFHGDQLLQVFEQLGLQYGDRDIFHFYGSGQEADSIRFSVANMLEPGTFDLNNMAITKTHGVTLFMLLPGQNNNAQTFDKLLDTGHRLAQRLGGELCDSQRGALTTQGANLIKESIHQFYSRRQTKQGHLKL